MFTKLFSKYLLIGLSAMVLLASAQQGLFNRQNAKLALADDHGEIVLNGPLCLDDDAGRSHAYWVTRYADGFEEKQGPNELCGCRGGENLEGGQCIVVDSGSSGSGADSQPVSSGLNCNPGDWINTCSNSVGAGHTYCVWDANGNYESECKIEACHSGTKAPPACVADLVSGGNSQSQWQCERDIAAGIPTCGDNITFCEDTGSNQSTIFLKRSGACNPSLQEADSRGCIFYHEPVEFREYACGGQPSQPAQNQQQSQQQQQSQSQQQSGARQTCYVCDGGSYRSTSSENCPANGNQTCNSSNPDQGSCLGASVGQSCGAQQQVPAVQGSTAVAVAIGTGGNSSSSSTSSSSSSSNSTSSVTINNPAQQVVTREVPRTFGNVGVGTTVYTDRVLQQGVQYLPQVLPKTGLPELAWSALAFIPTGFGLRRFSKVKKALENHPSYIFEDRQFKAGS